jgi:acetyl esterase
VTTYADLPPLERFRGAAARSLHRLPSPLKRALARGVPDAIDGLDLDLDVRAMLGAAQLSGRDKLGDRPLDVERRRFVRETVAIEGPPDRLYDVRDLTLPGPAGSLAARLYTPTRNASLPLLVHFHGGGHVVGNLDSCEGACRLLARHAGVAVLSVDYRLAPEHPFPAAVDDAAAAFAWAAEHAGELGADAGRIGVAGDSAGGNLAAAVCLGARDGGGPAPAFQLLIYPAVDLTRRRPSRDLFADGLQLTDTDIEWYRRQYLPDEADLQNPLASPLLAESLEGLPPAHVATAGFDPLRDEGEDYARALTAAGVSATLRRHEGLVHGFANYTRVVPAAREAMLETAEALRRGLRA